jgi:hypothetical protein
MRCVLHVVASSRHWYERGAVPNTIIVIPNRSPSAELPDPARTGRINSTEVRNLISWEVCIMGNEIPRSMAPRNDGTVGERSVVYQQACGSNKIDLGQLLTCASLLLQIVGCFLSWGERRHANVRVLESLCGAKSTPARSRSCERVDRSGAPYIHPDSHCGHPLY